MQQTDPVFSVNDVIVIEKGASSPFRYKWGFYGWKDNGYTGKFIVGYVNSINVDRLEATCYFYNPDIGDDLTFYLPLRGSEDYHEGQWSLPGFVRKVQTSDRTLVCECGSEARYGKDTNLHAHYCDKYQPYK